MTWRERLWRKPVPSCDLLSREFSCHLDSRQRLLRGTQQSDQSDFVSYVKADSKKGQKTKNKKICLTLAWWQWKQGPNTRGWVWHNIELMTFFYKGYESLVSGSLQKDKLQEVTSNLTTDLKAEVRNRNRLTSFYITSNMWQRSKKSVSCLSVFHD